MGKCKYIKSIELEDITLELWEDQDGQLYFDMISENDYYAFALYYSDLLKMLKEFD